MEKKYLIINLGSTSKRYVVYSSGEEVFSLFLQKKGSGYSARARHHGAEAEEKIPRSAFEQSINFLSESLLEFEVIEKIDEINAIGIRIVAPGANFLKNKLIDSSYVKELEKKKEDAPLHITPVLSELKQIKRHLAGIKIVGVSDSEFYDPLPEKAKTYGISKKVASKLGIYRQGYHGISVQSAVVSLKSKGFAPKKLIVCHLGGGSSVVALNNGKAADTSMGLTPLEGIFGGSRSGSIDPGVLIYLIKKLKLSVKGLDDFLNHESGLKGLTGVEDMRLVLAGAKNGNETHKKAIAAYVYQIQKYIGAYSTSLGGIDMIVFTGAIGEGSQYIRECICKGLSVFGVVFDNAKNKKVNRGEGFIQGKGSKVKLAVVKSRENDVIYSETKKLIK